MGLAWLIMRDRLIVTNLGTRCPSKDLGFPLGVTLRHVLRSRGTTMRRHFRVVGNKALKCVKDANKLARRLAYMMEYHYRKGTTYVLENPMSSLLWRFKCVRNCLKRHGAHRVVVNLGAYGAQTLKPAPLSKSSSV